MNIPKDFLWGVATASVQVEGAYNEDGKGLNIWDSLTKGHIAHNETCEVACDHYHRYKEDVKLMKEIGVNSYRFSVSWSRIFPNNDEIVNKKGLKFYSDLIDELKKNEIEPMVTLYHWDMPMWVYNEGGFLSENFVERFMNYVKVVVNELSDRVKYWFTFNEPQCFVGGGYESGWQAPYQKNSQVVIEKITKNVMLAHGFAVKYIRENAKTKPQIGFAPTASFIEPLNNSKEEIDKAYNLTTTAEYGCTSTGWWADPIVLGIIPDNMKFLTKKDIDIIHQPLDFYAFNIYQPNNTDEVYKQGMLRNSLGWVVTDNYIYYAIKFLYKKYNLPILISENGFTNNDVLTKDGKVHDVQRMYYLQNAIIQLKKATNENIPVKGYIYWSLMDNFEWSIGYDARFGLIYVDYNNNLNRIMKDSCYYYNKIIKSNGNDVDFVFTVK